MNGPDAGLPLEPVAYDPFAGGELARVVPTTEPQREIWLGDQLGHEASLSFNLSVSIRLRGVLDVAALKAALRELVARNDSMRMAFSPDGELLCVRRDVDIDIPLTDLSLLPDAAGRQAVLDGRLRATVETPFDLARDPLLRADLLRFSHDDHLLLLSSHHIACDGWSWWVIVRELGALYASHRGVQAPTLAPAPSFADYALGRASGGDAEAIAQAEEYWVRRFGDDVPVLDLPCDRARPAIRTFAAGYACRMLDAGLVAGIRQMGARRSASLFATMLAGFSTLLSRLSGQSRLVVGIPAAGQALDDNERLVGHCVNTLPLLFDIDHAVSFDAAIDASQDTLLDALDHQKCTFGSLLKKLHVQRDPARMPLVPVLFNIDQAMDDMGDVFPGLSMEFQDNPRTHDIFEMFLNAAQVRDGIRLECHYNSDLFDAATVQRWLEAYETLMREAVAGHAGAIGGLALAGGSAMRELLSLQSPQVDFDLDARVHELFERQCDRTPDRIAVRHGDATLTYAALDVRANRIAHLLRRHGIGRGDLVGVSVDRHPDLLAALLGILKSGAGYVPLDPAFPQERLAYMAEDAALAALVAGSAQAPRFDLGGRPVLEIDRIGDALAREPQTRPGRDDRAALAQSPAYVIYTSGSTGKPKGVQVPHVAVANFLLSMQQEPGLGIDDRLLAVTTTSFDIAVLELYLPLGVGAEVVLADREDAMDGVRLARLIERHAITVMQATPATWRLLVDCGWQGRAGFKALCGGEPLPSDLAMQLLSRCGELWNMYGPTETTVWSTCAKVSMGADDAAPDIHIGRPIANTSVWVLDERGQACPVGVAGELCIGGAGVTLGYLGRAELTAEKFIADPLSTYDAAAWGGSPMLYRTGDRGRWRGDGVLEHQGRLDFQVKVRGYRIELGEIEQTLLAAPGVARAVVIVREDQPGDVRIVAYVVAADGTMPADRALLDHLRASLPAYMVPQHLVRLDAIPLLPNGKIDRKALPLPVARGADEPAARAKVATGPRSPAVDYLASVWAAVLGAEAGPDDNFFDLGGHSMLAVKMANRVQQDTGVRLNLLMLASSTLGQLAETLPVPSTGGVAAGEIAGNDVRPSSAGAPQPFLFGPPERRLFGVFHPARGETRAIALACPPLLHEHVRSYRFFAGIADMLSEAGVACLRFDYHGTGDSGGDTTDFSPARVGDDIALAAAALRERAGAAPLALLGVRASALFARAHAGDVGAEALWLWQPVSDVGAYLDELDALDAGERGSRIRYPFTSRGPRAESNELLGFALAPGFREELQALGKRAPVPDMPTIVLDAAGADPAGEASMVALPASVVDWPGQVELEGLIQPRAARPAIDALLSGLTMRA